MSWLKAKDWASGVEYSSLFHSGLRAISLRSLIGTRTRAQSTAPISSPEKTKRRYSLSLKGVRPRPSSMFVCSTNELCEPWGKGGSFFDNIHEESFLSLSNDLDTFYRPLRRELPLSTQTMPMPSCRFSGHYRRERRERIDPAWMLEESSPELEAQDDGENADVTEVNLDGVPDWRQFHVDWLQNEPAVQLTTGINRCRFM
ncbi:uncharacterized protein F5147DRAFT_753608 [Suillus discolor]|uniref:Uncharacterized protein n=1 Tax=Suillus discolor TaxID=1912936 RepID=A0A9P7F4M4_9AGAM|nr:uncharacterized protein F5147DRAFT_753608 [Suillus discolor]KAG2107201.1 hypothetical protein F5147DRAFT_753608 [Suillus discolor]